jgi:hypothetical protein
MSRDSKGVLAYAALQINKRRRHPDMTGWRNDPDLKKPSGITTPHWG